MSLPSECLIYLKVIKLFLLNSIYLFTNPDVQPQDYLFTGVKLRKSQNCAGYQTFCTLDGLSPCCHGQQSSRITQLYQPNNPVIEDFTVDMPLLFKDYKKSEEYNYLGLNLILGVNNPVFVRARDITQ